jgi:hypothetical protein
MTLEIKRLWALIFSVLGFFDGLNNRVQATGNSLRSFLALAISSA